MATIEEDGDSWLTFTIFTKVTDETPYHGDDKVCFSCSFIYKHMKSNLMYRHLCSVYT